MFGKMSMGQRIIIAFGYQKMIKGPKSFFQIITSLNTNIFLWLQYAAVPVPASPAPNTAQYQPKNSVTVIFAIFK